MGMSPLRDAAREIKCVATAPLGGPWAWSSGKNPQRGKSLAVAAALLVLALGVSAWAADKKIEDTLKMVDQVAAQGPFRASPCPTIP